MNFKTAKTQNLLAVLSFKKILQRLIFVCGVIA